MVQNFNILIPPPKCTKSTKFAALGVGVPKFASLGSTYFVSNMKCFLVLQDIIYLQSLYIVFIEIYLATHVDLHIYVSCTVFSYATRFANLKKTNC